MIDPRVTANKEHYLAMVMIWSERAPMDRPSCQARARAAWEEIQPLLSDVDRESALAAWRVALATRDRKQFKDQVLPIIRRVFGA